MLDDPRYITKLDLRFITEKDKETFKEAIKIIDSIELLSEHIFDAQESWDTDLTTIRDIKFRLAGWERSNGAYKVAYIKDNLAVKSIPLNQFRAEKVLWLKTRYNPEWREYRKNLARIFGSYKGFIFQRKVGNINSNYYNDNEHDLKCKTVADKLGISDWWQNHGHDKDSNPVYFDSRK